MCGYGTPDAESEHIMIMAENGIDASKSMLVGLVLSHCADCGDPIPEARREVAIKAKHKCEYCIGCQVYHDKAPKVKMLDRIL